MGNQNNECGLDAHYSGDEQDRQQYYNKDISQINHLTHL